MESPLSWIGGKSQSAKKIVSLMPEHGCFVECFAGGLWVYFCKEPSKDEIINDINSQLINLYKIIQKDCNKFKEREKYELYSRELYYEYLNDFNSGKHCTLDNVEQAFRFFYMIKASFASRFGAGFAFSSSRQTSVSFFNEFKLLDQITKRLKNTIIDNRDFEDIIKSYDSPRTLYFCDPPYIKSDNDNFYFKSVNSTFTLNDHQRLFLALKKIKGKFILTVDDTSWIRERYTEDKGFYILENEVYYCSADKDNRGHVTELIITNYDTDNTVKHANRNQRKIEFL